MSVFVLDRRKRPLMPCSEKRARLLLERKRAVVHRRHPFTIRLRDRAAGAQQAIALKLDPGSKVTGIAITREGDGVTHPLCLAELTHRGPIIRKYLDQRAGYRQRRRSQNLRYRAPRFANRTRSEGWLAPSLRHRLETTMSWVARLRSVCPVTQIAVELVRFDLQKQTQPEIAGTAYQQGELFGYEVREYLLEKWGRACAYCAKTGTPLQVEHIVAKANGGSDRVANLALACRACNQRKGKRSVEAFLENKPALLHKVLARAKAPLHDAAAVNSTRGAIFRALQATGLPVEAASGGRTKYNRCRFGMPKTHALDALCVGQVDTVNGWRKPVLAIRAMGRGSYQRTRVTAYGFKRSYLMRGKVAYGFRTGDLVEAQVPHGKKRGVHVGRVAIRATGSFNLQTHAGVLQGISHRYCRVLQRGDGYAYASRAELPPALTGGEAAPEMTG